MHCGILNGIEVDLFFEFIETILNFESDLRKVVLPGLKQ